MSPTKQKILLLLFAGLDFSYAYHPGKKWRIIKRAAYQWKKINEKELQREINLLYKSKDISKKNNSDGTCSIVLTEKGRVKTLTYKFSEMKIENKIWDGKWRMVVFDIPEKIRKGRDALRSKIKELGFYELQKSVFILPYECKDEIEFIIEYFGIRKYVRYGTLDFIDNDIHLRKIFDLK